MPENLHRRFFQEILGVTIWEAVKFCFGLVFTASFAALASQLIIGLFATLGHYRWLLAIMFAAGGAYTFIAITQKLGRSSPRFPRLDFSFEIIEKEIYYEYFSRTRLQYRKRILLRALRNNLDTYHDKYHWTGQGTVRPKSTIKEQQYLETNRKSVWQFYEIKFQRSLRKGEEIETEILWDLEDSAGTALPFISATIEEPTRLLTLTMKLSPDLVPQSRECTCEIASLMGAKSRSARKRCDTTGPEK